jgi:medium-chain acyl-[acyl-carrier-protein] hydrolase
MKTRHANPWLYFGPHGANSQIRLLCLPYAGGNVSLFRSWSQQLPGEIQVCAVQLPGRQTRFQEPPITRMDALIDRLMEVVRPLSDLPLAIFGQCAGALVGFELARRLRQEQPPRPLAHLFAASCPAPDRCAQGPLLHRLPEEEFFTALEGMGGIPSDVMAMPELRAFVAPALRADFELYETYRHAVQEPLDCPVTVFCGAHDELVAEEAMRSWSNHTRRGTATYVVPGTHYLLEQSETQVLAAIARRLARFVAPPQALLHSSPQGHAHHGHPLA